MSTQSKSRLSGMITKVVVAVALVAGALVILSGLLMNVNNKITVKAQPLLVIGGQSPSSLSVFGVIAPQKTSASLASNHVSGPPYALALELALPRAISSLPAHSQVRGMPRSLALELGIHGVVSAPKATSQVNGPPQALAQELALP
jgi:hypothetical protein